MSDIFITENFLLQNDRAVELYHRFAEKCRSSTTTAIFRRGEIAEDRRFENLSQIWLARRSLQVAGDADGRRGGTLLHRRRLGLGEVPKVGRNRAADAPQSALPLDAPGTEAAVRHQRPAAESRHGRGHLGRVQREAGPAGVLLPRHHAADERRAGLHDRRSDRHAGTSRGDRRRPRRFPIQVLPTFRPDKAMAVESPAAFNAWVDRLAAASGIDIGDDFDRFLDALRQRHDFFHALGCRLSDHGLETFYADDYTAGGISAIFRRVRSGGKPVAKTTY